MNDLNMYEKGWIIGMLEGEASVGAWKGNQNRQVASNGRKYARIEISSVDHEALYHLQDLTGIGNINDQYTGNAKHKKTKTWRVGKAEDVLDLAMLWASAPFITDHRKVQILEAVAAASETVARKRSGESFSRKKELAA